MDFTNRGAQQSQTRTNNTNNSSAASSGGGTLKKLSAATKTSEPMWLRFIFVVLLFSLTVLAICIVALLSFGNPSEAKYVSAQRVQAVFLSNNQVYFGKIKELTPRHINLQSVYYLNSQQAQPDQGGDASNSKNTNFSLIKLGCEVHGPYDQMIINREQVVFWENLRTDGQVSKAIKQWQEQNPNGQQCKTDNNSSNNNTTDSTTKNTDANKSNQ